jgi:nucleoside-diphosphate-sugar epimerase
MYFNDYIIEKNMKSALVTGAGSFIGYEVVRRLVDMSIPTHVLVRPTSNINRLESLPMPPQIHTTDGSGSSLSDILNYITPEIIFHFAGAYTREEMPEDIPNLIQSNIQFSTQLLDAACRVNVDANKIKGVVNTGSYFQYFNSSNAVLNLYGATKNAFEKIAAYYSQRYNLPITTLVLFDVYGPRDWRAKLIPTIHDAQLSGKILDLPKNDLILNFVHSDDAVNSFIMAAEKLMIAPKEINLQNYAVRNDTDVRISEIVQLFEKIGQAPLHTNWGKWAASDREIKMPWKGSTLSGWQPKISLEEGINQLLEGKVNES